MKDAVEKSKKKRNNIPERNEESKNRPQIRPLHENISKTSEMKSGNVVNNFPRFHSCI